ncbi:hypothetical protein L9F63_003308, partial [Diploptera punctata]
SIVQLCFFSIQTLLSDKKDIRRQSGETSDLCHKFSKRSSKSYLISSYAIDSICLYPLRKAVKMYVLVHFLPNKNKRFTGLSQKVLHQEVLKVQQKIYTKVQNTTATCARTVCPSSKNINLIDYVFTLLLFARLSFSMVIDTVRLVLDISVREKSNGTASVRKLFDSLVRV